MVWNPFRKKTPVAEKKAPRPIVRRLKAGDFSRLTGDWTTMPVDIDALVKNNLRTVRARSREAYHDNDYARRFISLCTTNIVGPQGVRLQVRSRNARGKLDSKANDAIEEAWKEWTGDPDLCDVENAMAFHEMENMIVRTVAVDGEVFIRKVVGLGAGKMNFQLLLLDAERFDVRFDLNLQNGNVIRQSIEFDPFGRRVAYYMRTSGPGDDVIDFNGSPVLRIPASEIIHVYMRQAVGQKRGLPWMMAGLFTIKMVDGYDEAAIVAARSGAAKMGFIEETEGAQYQGDDLEDDDEPEGDQISDFEAGTIERLGSGLKFTGWDPVYPHSQYPAFHDAQVRRLAAGLLVSFHSLAADLKDVNFSSIRHGTLEERDVWRCHQQWLTLSVHRRIYRDWLSLQLAAGSITVGTQPLAIQKEDKYRRVIWQARGWDWVSPKDDVGAKKEEVGMGSRSLSSVIREKGGDPEEVFAEIAEEREKMAELGITPSIVAESVLPSTPTEPEEGSEQENEQ